MGYRQDSHPTDKMYLEKKNVLRANERVSDLPQFVIYVLFFFSANVCVDEFKKRYDFLVDYSIPLFC